MMSARKSTIAVLVVLSATLTAADVVRAAGPRRGHAELSGYGETPTLSTPASGTLELRISKDGDSVAYTLKYEGFVNTVTQSHIHLGRPAINGGIMVFLCTNLTPPVGVPLPPPCPSFEGKVSGMLTAANVGAGAAGQGLTTGEFKEFVEALRAEATYGNVHTNIFPGGEIRGEVVFHGGEDD